MSEYTQGPWTQGRLLLTRETIKLTRDRQEQLSKLERRYVYSNFSIEDEGLSRTFIAECQRGEDARLVAYAPDLLETLVALVSAVSEGGETQEQQVIKAQDIIAKVKKDSVKLSVLPVVSKHKLSST